MPQHVSLDEGADTSRSTDASSADIKAPPSGHAVVAKKADGKSEISGAVFNLANAVRRPRAAVRAPHDARSPPRPTQVIGAGVGGMPYALKLGGFYGGAFLILMVACCSDYSLRLLVTLSRKTKSKCAWLTASRARAPRSRHRAPATAHLPHALSPRADYEDLMSSQFGHMGYIF